MHPQALPQLEDRWSTEALRSLRRTVALLREAFSDLARALEESERIARLVEGLLLLSRAEAGVLRLERQAVDLARLVAEVGEDAQVLAEAWGVALEVKSVASITMPGDRAHLRRLLLNLVDNGIKYTPTGGRVRLTLQRDGEWATLHVADTGIGLAPEELERIFQRFYRSPEAVAQGKEGSGLGLCIARSIAQAHGGRIDVESSPGHGSTFTVLLPLRA
jgi:signal transduction histidine kinase